MKRETRESERTQQEVKLAQHDVNKARILAAHIAELVFAQDETVPQKILAAGILFGGMAALGGLDLKSAYLILEDTHGSASKFSDEEGLFQ